MCRTFLKKTFVLTCRTGSKMVPGQMHTAVVKFSIVLCVLMMCQTEVFNCFVCVLMMRQTRGGALERVQIFILAEGLKIEFFFCIIR